MQVMPLVLLFAFAKAGRSMPARIAMIAITTSNSIRVKAPFFGFGAHWWLSINVFGFLNSRTRDPS
jgi:hypothetical protein